MASPSPAAAAAADLLADQPPPPAAAAEPPSPAASSSSISSDSPDDEGFETASDPESDSAAPDAGVGTPEAAAPAAGAEDSAPAGSVQSGAAAEAAAAALEGAESAPAGSGEGENGAGGAVEKSDAVVDPAEAESVIVDGVAAEQVTDGGEKIGAVADDVDRVVAEEEHGEVETDVVRAEQIGVVVDDVEDRSEAAGVVAGKDGEKIVVSGPVEAAAAVGVGERDVVGEENVVPDEAVGVVAAKDGEKIVISGPVEAAAAVGVGERDVVGEENVVPDEAVGAGLEKVAGKDEENRVADEAVDSDPKAAASASAVTVDGAVDVEGGKDGVVEAVVSRETVGSEVVQVEGVKDGEVEVVDSGKILEDKPVEVEGVKGGDVEAIASSEIVGTEAVQVEGVKDGDVEVVDSVKILEDKPVEVEGVKGGDVEVVDSGKILEDKAVVVEGVKGGDVEVVDSGKILEDKAVVVEGEKDDYVEANDSGEVLDDKPKLQLVEADSSAVDGSDGSIKEVVESSVVDGGPDQAPVASELEAVCTVDVVEKIDAVENPIENGLESAGDATQVDQNAAPVGLEEAAGSKEETVIGDSGKIEVTDIADSDQGIEMIDGSKAVEVEGVKGGDVDAVVSEETIEEVAKLQTAEVESNLVDSEETGLDSGDVSDRGIKEGRISVTTKDSADKLDVSDENVGLDAIEVDDKVTSTNGGSGSADSEVAKDFVEKHEILNEDEAVDGVAPVKQEVVDEKADIESTELKSSLVTAEGTQTREVEPISVVEREAVADIGGTDTAVAVAADDDDEKLGKNEAEEAGKENNGSISGSARVASLESSETAKQMIKETEEGSSSSSYRSGFRSSGENSHHLDGQIVTDSEEEVDTDDEGEGRELFDSAALTALLKAATGASSDGSITITPEDATRIFSVNRPTGLGSSVPSLKPAPSRTARPSSLTPSDATVVALPENNMPEEEKKLQEKVEQIRVKFLRLVQRLGHSPEDTVAAQVLYRLGLAEGIRHGRQISRLFSIENAKKKALQLEEDGNENLDFSCNILVLGKTGVGKSATINSIFGEGKSGTSPFEPATTSVRQISGIVDGVKIHVLDTPGLKTSVMDQAANRKILLAIKKQTKRCPPDIVLYVDRMDTQTRDLNDLPLLRSITSILGSSIWFNAIVALTHAASAPPDGPNGSPLSYEVFIAQRSHVVQHSIRQAAGDMRLMNPVALVENHPSCRRNREGERVLPNGLSWRPQLLLLCYSSKILSEANALLKLQDPSPGKLFGFRLRSPPLPYLLSSLLQSKTHPKLASDQGGDGDSDIDLDDVSDTDQGEEDDEYEQLPPFKPLRKSQIAKLTKEQKRAYLDEYDYRVKLLQKKQWKDELRRMKEMKKKGKNPQDDLAYGDMPEDFDQEGAPASVPVPLPDMVLPPTFDAENPVYRYRLLEPTSEFRTRPASESHLDHDCGYDGVSIEENLAIAGRFPAGMAIQITKDKNDFNLHVDSSISAKHGENGSTLAGFDVQQIGKQLAYVLRGETKFNNLKKNKTTAGASVTFLGETVAAGMKIEDQLSIGNRVGLVATTGAIRSQGDMAYGANLEARLKDKDYPIGQALTTLGLSLMKWRSDLALGANLQSQFSVGRSSKMAVRVGLNNKLTGQVTVRTSTSEQLQIALLGILPLAVAFYRRISSGEPYMDQ